MEIGDKVRFKPAAFFDSTNSFSAPGKWAPAPIEVTGTVTYINETHRYYRVEYAMPGCIGHECFKI